MHSRKARFLFKKQKSVSPQDTVIHLKNLKNDLWINIFNNSENQNSNKFIIRVKNCVKSVQWSSCTYVYSGDIFPVLQLRCVFNNNSQKRNSFFFFFSYKILLILLRSVYAVRRYIYIQKHIFRFAERSHTASFKRHWLYIVYTDFPGNIRNMQIRRINYSCCEFILPFVYIWLTILYFSLLF